MSPTQTGVVDGSGRVGRTGVNPGTAKIKIMYVHNARWSKDEAAVGETVKLLADVEGFDPGSAATFMIWRKNPDGGDYPVEEITAETKGSSVEAEWVFELPDDDEDEGLGEDDNPDEESSEVFERRREEVEVAMAASPFDLPRYYFFVEVGAAPKARSTILSFKDWIELELRDADENPIADAAYDLILVNGQVRSGKLDGNGYAKEEDLPPGDVRVVYPHYPMAVG